MTWFKRDTFTTLSSILIATSITSMILRDSQIFSIASKTTRMIRHSF